MMHVKKMDERITVVHEKNGTGPLFPTVMPTTSTQFGERFFTEINNPLRTFDQASVGNYQAEARKSAEEVVLRRATVISRAAIDAVLERPVAHEATPAAVHAGETAVAAQVAVPDVIAGLEAAQTMTMVGANA